MASDPLPIPAGWPDALERSKVDFAAGRSVPLGSILERVRRIADLLALARTTAV